MLFVLRVLFVALGLFIMQQHFNFLLDDFIDFVVVVISLSLISTSTLFIKGRS